MPRLTIAAGEVVGVAGIAGNGQEELYALATGLARPARGRVRLLGAPAPAGARGFVAAGVAAIPGDRLAHALAPSLAVEENLALKELALRRRFLRGGPAWLGVVDRGRLREHARARIAEAGVSPPDPARALGALSGGNQQRVLLARELEGSPPLVVALDPTRGLDVVATALVARELARARDAGAGVLLIATDLDEVLALATRVAVLHAGRLLEPPPGADRAAVGLLMLRGSAA